VDNLYINSEGESTVGIKKDELYLKFQNARRFMVVLKEGDLLYIPSFWYHEDSSNEGF
jgi:ribosomal protein L16 Arg81 hydroxylase